MIRSSSASMKRFSLGALVVLGATSGACSVRVEETGAPVAGSVDACAESALGCAKDGSGLEGTAIDGPELQKSGEVIDYVIHVGGICTTSFLTGTGGKALSGDVGRWPGFVSISAPVDQQESMATAVADLTETLDAFCRGERFCHLYGYSNGGAVISETLSLHDDDRWNVAWVLTTASNEGGSELSESSVVSLGVGLGLTCPLASEIAPSDHRPAWNHHDTGGHTFYSLSGHQEWWYTGSAPDFFADGANDGAVGYHSTAALVSPWIVPDDDPWVCYADETYYANHQPAFDCRGFDREHGEMKMLGIELTGG